MAAIANAIFVSRRFKSIRVMNIWRTRKLRKVSIFIWLNEEFDTRGEIVFFAHNNCSFWNAANDLARHLFVILSDVLSTFVKPSHQKISKRLIHRFWLTCEEEETPKRKALSFMKTMKANVGVWNSKKFSVSRDSAYLLKNTSAQR
ncbi:Polycystin-1-like protein [Trichinella spiralis]|uniref:Polycystin-1-like protein n=1 Tax=Trichinella spiralis TaxID=6334 RepID=A0ABR3KR50_TRISP